MTIQTTATEKAAARGEAIVSSDQYDHDTPHTDVQDALSDLMHYFDTVQASDDHDLTITFEDILNSARFIYNDEKRDPAS
ncbi:hypothetical protein [Frigoribacterium sp. CG_9.8]|uniref:hypothetical protein n=1 Tax=Frigoribacterium sp. CG_9.8 TaxID=2787733 RepID=UPI0018C9B28F|nr:hypothetical protein [Frigoribacterium sp. CG_9.8]MBG6106587.1 hypothetical protein [Frigoribacterium sp. CG_9.8]